MPKFSSENWVLTSSLTLKGVEAEPQCLAVSPHDIPGSKCNLATLKVILTAKYQLAVLKCDMTSV